MSSSDKRVSSLSLRSSIKFIAMEDMKVSESQHSGHRRSFKAIESNDIVPKLKKIMAHVTTMHVEDLILNAVNTRSSSSYSSSTDSSDSSTPEFSSVMLVFNSPVQYQSEEFKSCVIFSSVHKKSKYTYHKSKTSLKKSPKDTRPSVNILSKVTVMESKSPHSKKEQLNDTDDSDDSSSTSTSDDDSSEKKITAQTLKWPKYQTTSESTKDDIKSMDANRETGKLFLGSEKSKNEVDMLDMLDLLFGTENFGGSTKNVENTNDIEIITDGNYIQRKQIDPIIQQKIDDSKRKLANAIMEKTAIKNKSEKPPPKRKLQQCSMEIKRKVIRKKGNLMKRENVTLLSSSCQSSLNSPQKLRALPNSLSMILSHDCPARIFKARWSNLLQNGDIVVLPKNVIIDLNDIVESLASTIILRDLGVLMIQERILIRNAIEAVKLKSVELTKYLERNYPGLHRQINVKKKICDSDANVIFRKILNLDSIIEDMPIVLLSINSRLKSSSKMFQSTISIKEKSNIRRLFWRLTSSNLYKDVLNNQLESLRQYTILNSDDDQ